MKKKLFAVLALFSASLLAADDGSWMDYRGYTLAEGALYSETVNPDVVLEKEYLELGDYKSGATRAVYQFRNASKEALVVECSFPVKIEWDVKPIKLGPDMELTKESGPGVQRGWDYDAKSFYPPKARGPYRETIDDWLAALGVRRATRKPEVPVALPVDPEDYVDHVEPEFGGKFISEADYPRGRRELPPESFLGRLKLAIVQDGKSVPVTACFADFGAKPGLVNLYFRHRLPFAANSVSRVEVSYAFPGGAFAWAQSFQNRSAVGYLTT